jgi:nitrogen fixation protein FixH
MKRNLWPLAILLYFVVFISALVVWIVFATHNDPQLVRKDYYEQELSFQRQIDGERRASTVDLKLEYDNSTQSLAVSLPSEATKASLYLYRPSNAKLDREFALSLADGGDKIDVRGLEAGLWKVRLTWTAGGLEYLRETTIIFAPTKLSSL